MADMDEIRTLIAKAEAMGAIVNTVLDVDAWMDGQEVYETVQVLGLKGVGPWPMSLIAATETLRKVMA